jgi:hypothetical protein
LDHVEAGREKLVAKYRHAQRGSDKRERCQLERLHGAKHTYHLVQLAAGVPMTSIDGQIGASYPTALGGDARQLLARTS